MPYKIQLNSFPACCGIYILTCFYQNPDTNEEAKRYINAGGSYAKPETIAKAAKEGSWETKDEYKKRVFSELNEFTKEYSKKKSWLIATLNVTEYEHLHKVMLDAGFEVIMPETSNPTGSKIITYGYNLMVRPEVVKKKVSSIVGMRRGV